MPRFIARFCMAASALALCAAFGSSAQAVTLKWITFKPQNAGDAQAISTQWFVDEFKKHTGGKSEIQMSGAAASPRTRNADFLSGGAADMGDIITPYFRTSSRSTTRSAISFRNRIPPSRSPR